jgi:hypothetical protein
MSEYQEQSCVISAGTNSSLLPYIITKTVHHYCDIVRVLTLSELNIAIVNETNLSGPKLENIL